MAKRADNHDGSCREILTGRHAGKWRVQFAYTNDRGQKVRVDRILPTKTKGKELLQSLRRGERIAHAANERETTLGEWFEWLAEHDWPEAIADVTIAYRRGRFRKYVQKQLGDVPLGNIDPLQVREFYRSLRNRGVSDSLLQEVRADLVRVFNQAIVPYQRIPMSVANPFRLPLQRPKPRSAVALTPDQVKAALACKSLSASERALLGLFLLAGLRLGEVMAITYGQLHFEQGLITIDRAVHVAYAGKQTVGLPKGGKKRNAVMCQRLATLLEAICENLESDCLLFPSESGVPKMKKVIYAAWRRIVASSGLPESMSPHDCRLTHVNIIEKLMPAVSTTTLKEHVGHATNGVTETNYTRPITSAQAILREELDRHFGP